MAARPPEDSPESWGEDELLRRGEAARVAKAQPPTKDRVAAAEAALHALTEPVKQVREAARQQAHDEWVRNQPRPTSPRLVPDRVLEWGGGRLRRRTKQHRWDEGLLESCRQAAEKAVREYREQFRLTHGVDPEDLVKDARRKLHLLWDEENEFKHAADMVMREVSRRLHWEWKWDVDQIAERLHRTYDEVRRDVEIPDPHRRSRAHGSRGGSDDGSRYYGFGDETGPRFSEGGGGGGSGE